MEDVRGIGPERDLNGDHWIKARYGRGKDAPQVIISIVRLAADDSQGGIDTGGQLRGKSCGRSSIMLAYQ